MQIKKAEDKKLFFTGQRRIERGKTKASPCIYYAEALCFAPQKRYKRCEDCPKIRNNYPGEKVLYRKIVDHAIEMLKQRKSSPPSYELKL